jgi:hypothetical protein
MNAHQRRTLNRKTGRKAATIVAEQDAHPKARIESQSKTTDKKEQDTEPIPQKNKWARAWHISKRTVQILGTLIGFVAAILGIVSGYYGLEQRISVSQGEPLDEQDPFSTPFIISNDGPLPIENIRYTCGIGHTSYKNGPQIKGAENYGTFFIFLPSTNGKMPMPGFGAIEMNPGERSTISSCAYPFPKTIEGGDIGIVVSYRVGYTPIKQTRIFRFGTLPDANNKLHWFPYPLK